MGIERPERAGQPFYFLKPPTTTIIGPDLVQDPQRLGVRLTVNGVVKQDSSTADMVCGIWDLIAAASRIVTLEPGDVIATGTPAGVGVPRGDFLTPGDEVVAEIEQVSTLRHVVVGSASESGSGEP
jgi:2-keto-4-pentenoate hydratase/2-oxohepta-3-ene-1,7-dioic acid hydratase in catechol pathway